MKAVRQALAGQSKADAAPSAAKPSAAERLKQLKSLQEQGLIQ